MGMYLNKHLEPHMLDLALDITNLTRDDLFYYKNKDKYRPGSLELPPDRNRAKPCFHLVKTEVRRKPFLMPSRIPTPHRQSRPRDRLRP